MRECCALFFGSTIMGCHEPFGPFPSRSCPQANLPVATPTALLTECVIRSSVAGGMGNRRGRELLARRIRLRAWQQAALEALQNSKQRDFLAVATPGAGKTTFALVAARRALASRVARRLIVVVPTQHLKLQWALAAEELALHIDPEWSTRYGGLPSDVHGVAVTYQQVAASPSALRPLVGRAFVILDEVHHAADTRSWGDGIREAFKESPQRLCLSGTPFRSDQSAIPFVRYQGDEAEADFEYGYGEALQCNILNFIKNAIHTDINISEREPEPEYNSDRARMKV